MGQNGWAIARHTKRWEMGNFKIKKWERNQNYYGNIPFKKIYIRSDEGDHWRQRREEGNEIKLRSWEKIYELVWRLQTDTNNLDFYHMPHSYDGGGMERAFLMVIEVKIMMMSSMLQNNFSREGRGNIQIKFKVNLNVRW